MKQDFRMKPSKDSGILNLTRWCSGSEGMVLVLTLMMLTLITAMVVEFAYGVYTSTSALYNWRDSQRLSFIAKSGVAMAVNTISRAPRSELYKYLGKEIPVPDVSEGFSGSFIIKAEDENSKFNLNSLVWPNGQKNAYDSFIGLLDYLGLETSIADRIVHWINPVSSLGLRYSGDITKSASMDSVDELLLIKGIDYKTYEKLLPYVTVYGYDGTPGSRLINMNTAPIPVIMSLAGSAVSIFKDDAERIVSARDLKPFTSTSDENFAVAAGSLKTYLTDDKVGMDASNFRITAIAEQNKIKRVIEAVVRIGGGSQGKILFWREI